LFNGPLFDVCFSQGSEEAYGGYSHKVLARGVTVVSDNGSLQLQGASQLNGGIFTAVKCFRKSRLVGISADPVVRQARSEKLGRRAELSSICCALRSAVHSSLGTTPYYMVFGQHSVGSGSTYKLLRALGLIQDRSVVFAREDSLELMK